MDPHGIRHLFLRQSRDLGVENATQRAHHTQLLMWNWDRPGGRGVGSITVVLRLKLSAEQPEAVHAAHSKHGQKKTLLFDFVEIDSTLSVPLALSMCCVGIIRRSSASAGMMAQSLLLPTQA
jgi:hypothetical protein